MKNLLYFILFTVAAVVTACSHGSHQQQLVQVDSLLKHKQSDSAYHALKQIERNGLSGEQESMHYDLLQLMLSQGMSPDSFDFDTSREMVAQRLIAYNRRTGNKRDLLLCHLYYGKILLLDQHDYAAATVYLKKAEELLPQVNDIDLNYLTNEALATLNYYSGNEELAMGYSYKTQFYAQQSGKPHHIFFASNHLLLLNMENNDSVNKYNELCMSTINEIPPKERAYALGNIGAIFFLHGRLDEAENYFQRALTEYPHTYIRNNLATTLYQKGKYNDAKELWDKSQQSSNLRDQVNTYTSILASKYGRQDYEGASLAAMRLLEVKDSLFRQENSVEVLEIQKKYDKEVARRKLNKTIIRVLVGLLVLIALIAILIVYHMRKSSRDKEHIMRDQVLINDYQRQIEQLERSGQEANIQVTELKQKIVDLQTERAKRFAEGEELFNRITAGEPVADWDKSQVSNFIEYYKLVNLSFMMQVEHEYTSLTDNNRLFLILEHMGKSNDEISHILGVTSTTLRSIRLRLRKKHNPQ